MPPRDPVPAPARTVTLLTGDRVSIEGGAVSMRAAPGRAKIGFVSWQSGNDTIVIPRDVVDRVASDELDVDLFNVSYLMAKGYNDASQVPRDHRAAQDVALAGEPVTLTLQVLDRTGAPTSGLGFITNVDPDSPNPISLLARVNRPMSLPPQTYTINLLSGFGEALVSIYPRFKLTEDTTLVLDGRQAGLVSVGVAGVELEIGATEIRTRDFAARQQFTVTGEGAFATGHFGPRTAPGELLSTIAFGATPAGSTDGASVYAFARREWDQMIVGWTETLQPSQLATVRAIHSGSDDVLYAKAAVAVPDGLPDREWLGFPEPLTFNVYRGPFERTEHYFGDSFQWAGVFQTLLDLGDERSVVAEAQSPLQRYRAGTTREAWNRAPYGPAFSSVLGLMRATRTGDELSVSPSLFSAVASPSQLGLSVGTFRTALFRGDELIAEEINDGFEPLRPVQVAPERAIYRLESEATRHELVPIKLSSEVRGTWTFASQQAGKSPEVLPLPVLRFAPELDRHNRASRRLPLVLPVTVERPAGARRPAITSVRIEASFDDGATWSPVIGVRINDQWRGVVFHPPGATLVSLRGSARDAEGNRVEQTIIRAYEIAP